ncbi:MAG: hypothetical protein JWQ89_1073 [Devosia sp.]|uniref:RICIN domain-containing protein n=1 Tax=Devosia sp. TaxID=1871048 RepID=UPI00260B2D65|nr:hypothetical protein [Devosia sp.]MDB5539346.1 hypothetical protein [Devosia sp.]
MVGGLAALFLFVATLPASAQGPYYELVETVIDPNNDPNWTVSDGHISLKDVNGTYSVEYSWSPPPRTSDSAGFDVNLNIDGKATPNRVYAGIGINSPSGGFSFDKDPAGADVSVPDAAAGGSESRSNSISVHAMPSASYGDDSVIELRIGAYYAYGVTYRYRVSATPVIITPPQQGRLSVTVDCPTDIVVGALPSLNCHLLISGFRRNTADPVEVIVPNMLDQFGNHANGIQVVDLDGAEDVFNWVEPHSWGFFVFACSGPNIGANCYDNMATPGPASIPVIVQQTGLEPVNLLLSFNVVGKGAQLGGLGQEVRIGSRWIASTFINSESGLPDSTTILLDWLSARWTLDPVEGGYVRIHSVWKPNQYLHVENGSLEVGPIRPEWQSAMWQMESSGGGYYVRFRNVWQADTYLNVESGHLASTPIGADWLSADWWLLQ